MSALDILKQLLGSAAVQPMARPWLENQSIDKHIQGLQSHLKDGASEHVPKDLQEEAVKRFWTTKRLENLKEARLVSFGIALPVGPQRVCIIEDRERFPALLDGVDEYLPTPKRYRRCYQGLLAGYFTYDPWGSDTPATGKENWNELRKYLGNHARRVEDASTNPGWVDVLQEHQSLLSEDPCGRYGALLLDDKKIEIDALREGLSISDASWFTRSLFLAQIVAATKRGDVEFQSVLYRLLALLTDNEIVRDEGLALVLNRYADIQPAPLAIPLRDSAVSWWGNPWLASNSMRWGRVSVPARALVTEWLKLEFIEAFFSLLADERIGDTRRPDFWKRYVHVIENIHFALGTGARLSRDRDFVELRKKMQGLSVPLQDQVRSNNAFIMQIGPVAIVEFGGHSNACYGYDSKRPLPFDVTMPVVTPLNANNSLKHDNHVLKLKHQDGILGWAKWEQMFEATLKKDFNIVPKIQAVPTLTGTSHARPAPRSAATLPAPAASADRTWQLASWNTTALTRKALFIFAERFGFAVEDLTGRNGNLWVRTDESDDGVNAILRRWGFRYKPGKGWWR